MVNIGRVLILPKGKYDSNTTYNMLDIVLHNGTSWLCKKTTTGIEPSEENGEYWQILIEVNEAIDSRIENFFGSSDSPLPLTLPSLSLYNKDYPEARGMLDVDSTGALNFGGNAIFHLLNIDNYLNPFLNNYMKNNLETYTDALASLPKMQKGTYVGTGEKTFTLNFDISPSIVMLFTKYYLTIFVRGYGSISYHINVQDMNSSSIIWDEWNAGSDIVQNWGHRITWGEKSLTIENYGTVADGYSYRFNGSGGTYNYIAIGGGEE